MDLHRPPAAAGPTRPLLDERRREQARQEGFDPDSLERAFGVVADAVEKGAIPGAVMLVGRSEGDGVGPVAIGHRAILPAPEPMEVHTLFDMASLTKVMATAILAMMLVERGQLRLGAAVTEYLPEFAGEVLDERRKQVRIFHLLTHTSGLPAWRALYEGCRDGEPCRAAMERRLLSTPLEAAPGSQVTYSCLGYITLGLIIERLTGQGLDSLARRWVYEPLGMDSTMYRPPEALRERCAATEYCPLRWRIVQGEVHDENAYFFGGVSGNAGLFSTAADTGRFARLMLGKGAWAGRRVMSEAAVEAMTRNHTAHLNEARGLGWAVRANSLDSSAGDLMSPSAFGHTGFTGTSLWVDPERDLYCVLLTNRVHPSRQNEVHVALRPAFHNAVVAALA